MKERLQALESLKKEDDPKFATPDGSENPKEKSNLAQPHDGAEEGQPSQTVARVTPRTSHVEDEQKPTTTAADLGAQEQGTAFAVMLKLMEGMQALQRQMLESKNEEKDGGSEFVRGAPALPPLAEWNPTTGPIDLNDLLALIEPMMSDLTNTSSHWWQILMSEATAWYQRHLQLQPLDRVSHTPNPSSELAKAKWCRLEKRASTLLLMAVPEAQREELISSKRLSALLMIYQPGGLAEKELILRSLETPNESSTLSEAVQNLRRWTRWRRRAADLRISEPDPFLLWKGLNRIIRKPLEANRDLSFRIPLARSTLQVDATPTSTSVTSFALHLLAEFEQVVHQETATGSKKKQPEEKEKVKASVMKQKRLEEETQKNLVGRKEKSEEEKQKCKFFLSESGCRRGKSCTWSHDQRDEKRRCYVCGSPEHLSSSCTRPRSTSESPTARQKAQKVEGEETSTMPNKEKEEEMNSGASSMKELLEQANRMLKSLTSTPSTTSSASSASQSGDSREDVVERLQQQINSLKLKTFKISRVAYGGHQGLVDSGATHPLRPRNPGEAESSFRQITVTLANGESSKMHMTPGGVMISQRQDVEPIIPMGQLVHQLGCSVDWTGDHLKIFHPRRGALPVQMQQGCPQLPRKLALDLIAELELLNFNGKMNEVNYKEEVTWMKQLVETHPVLRQLPERIRERLVVEVGDWKHIPVNRKQRKKFQRDGMILHMYSGENSGFTLGRAWKQCGGEPAQLFEIDIKNGAQFDLLDDVGIYSGLLRAVLDDKVHAITGGPNCRSRSVLRNYPIPNMENW